MEKIAVDWIEKGRDINELMEMPFHFVVEILKDKNEREKQKKFSNSFFDLLT